MASEPIKDLDQPAQTQLISLYCPSEDASGPSLPIDCPSKTQIRLRGLGAQSILLEISRLILNVQDCLTQFYIYSRISHTPRGQNFQFMLTVV